MVKKKIKVSDILGDSYYVYELTPSNYTPTLNSTIIILCIMKDIYGTAASGKSITLYQNGMNKGSQTTNSSGVATWSVTCSKAGIQSFKVGSKTIEVFVDNKIDKNYFNVDYVHSFVYNSNTEKYGYAGQSSAVGIGVSAIDENDNSLLNKNGVAIIDLVFQNTNINYGSIQLVLAEADGRSYSYSGDLSNTQTIATIDDTNEHHITIVVSSDTHIEEQSYDYYNLKVSKISYDGSDITVSSGKTSMEMVGVYLVFDGVIDGNIEYMNVIKRTPIVNQIIDTIYPIGSIYISVNSVNPSFLFGGEWEQIQDRFLLASGSTYSAGATGGEATHTLTENEMPSHTHIQNSHNHTQNSHNHTQNAHNHALTGSKSVGIQEGDKLRVGYGSKSGGKNTNNTTATNKATTATNKEATATNQNTGGGQAHNNMPPYLAVYMWKRIA